MITVLSLTMNRILGRNFSYQNIYIYAKIIVKKYLHVFKFVLFQ